MSTRTSTLPHASYARSTTSRHVGNVNPPISDVRDSTRHRVDDGAACSGRRSLRSRATGPHRQPSARFEERAMACLRHARLSVGAFRTSATHLDAGRSAARARAVLHREAATDRPATDLAGGAICRLVTRELGDRRWARGARLQARRRTSVGRDAAELLGGRASDGAADDRGRIARQTAVGWMASVEAVLWAGLSMTVARTPYEQNGKNDGTGAIDDAAAASPKHPHLPAKSLE